MQRNYFNKCNLGGKLFQILGSRNNKGLAQSLKNPLKNKTSYFENNYRFTGSRKDCKEKSGALTPFPPSVASYEAMQHDIRTGQGRWRVCAAPCHVMWGTCVPAAESPHPILSNQRSVVQLGNLVISKISCPLNHMVCDLLRLAQKPPFSDSLSSFYSRGSWSPEVMMIRSHTPHPRWGWGACNPTAPASRPVASPAVDHIRVFRPASLPPHGCRFYSFQCTSVSFFTKLIRNEVPPPPHGSDVYFLLCN